MENWHFSLFPCGFQPVTMAEAKKTFWVSDIYWHRGEKTQKQAKLKLWTHELQWSLRETGRCGTTQKCLTWLHGRVSNSEGATVKRVVTQNRGHQHTSDVKTISVVLLYFCFLSLSMYKTFLCWSSACRYQLKFILDDSTKNQLSYKRKTFKAITLLHMHIFYAKRDVDSISCYS